MKSENKNSLCIIPMPVAASRLNKGISTIYGYLDKNSKYFKRKFPRPVKDGSSIGFIEHEIDDYIGALMEARPTETKTSLTRKTRKQI